MPDQQLQESLECLVNVFGWSQLATSAERPASLPKAPTRAKIGTRRTRPEFYAE
jgi:hypothetical protein